MVEFDMLLGYERYAGVFLIAIRIYLAIVNTITWLSNNFDGTVYISSSLHRH